MVDIAEQFKKITEGLFKKSSESVLGVDVSSSTIKAVQLKRRGGKAVLETYGELELSSYAGIEAGAATKLSTDKMSEALRDLLGEAKVTTTLTGIAIPLSASLIHVIQMPDVGESKLKEMVPIEMRKYIPVSISEVYLDWRVIPRGRDEVSEESDEAEKEKLKKVDVLVVAIHKETISKYQEIVRGAGLQADFFEIEVFSTVRSVLDGESSPVMIMDMGAGTTKIYVVDHRVLRQSHIINRGSRDISRALSKSLGIPIEEAVELKHTHGLDPNVEDKNIREVITLVLDSIFNEAHRVLLNYEKAHQQNISHAIISGGGSALKGIAEEASKALETEATIADPFKKVETPAFLEGTLTEAGPDFAVALGVALRRLNDVE